MTRVSTVILEHGPLWLVPLAPLHVSAVLQVLGRRVWALFLVSIASQAHGRQWKEPPVLSLVLNVAQVLGHPWQGCLRRICVSPVFLGHGHHKLAVLPAQFASIVLQDLGRR